MGQFKDISIKNVVEELNKSYFLPDIQREYVWLQKADDKKIEQLFDSILRGYPIGSFLFWKLKKNDIETNKDAREDSEKLNFQLYKFIERYDVRGSHNEKINIEQINADDISIVLDGQQRLTSLYIGLKGTRTLKKPRARYNNPNAYEEKHLYLNLFHQPEEERPDDNYQFEFYKKDELPQNNNQHYCFKVGDILTIDSVFDFVEENKLLEINKEACKLLERLKNAFCSERLISYFEEEEKNLDKVLRIFIRVNSGGTQLSYSDLLMSILTANFSTDIRGAMNAFVDSIKQEGFGVMGRDQVLKTCLLLTESNHIFQLKNFNKTNIQKIEENWKGITEAIYKAVTLLKEFGYAYCLSSSYIISIITYYLFKNKPTTEPNKGEILRFIQSTQVTAYFTTSLDTKLGVVAKVVKDSSTFKEINEKLINRKLAIYISKDDIEGMLDRQYGHPLIFPILQLLYPNLDYKNSTFHIDHIYPKSKFKELPNEYHSRANFLYNLQLLEGGENGSKKQKDPEDWLKEHFNGDTDKITEYKCRNYIDRDFDLNWDNIADFERERSKKIKEKLIEIFK